MSDLTRKRSTSSDSELSDGWSLVEHPDTVPQALCTSEMTPQLHSPVPQLHAANQLHVSSARHHPSSPSDETSSDAESVEIIQEDARHADFSYPHGISRITNIHTREIDKEALEREKDPIEVKEVMLNDYGSDYLISTASVYFNEWFRLLVFISSLVALLLLLASYTSLFVKEQAYSKADGLIVLPDEDLSSLIADLALVKEENSRLKEELNMVKYEYGNNKKMNVKNEDSFDGVSTDDIGLEVISEDSPLNVEPISFNPLTISLDTTGKTSEKISLDQLKKLNAQRNRIEDLTQFEDNLKTLASNIGLKNIVVSSYKIVNNLESINSIIKNLKSTIDKDVSSKKENKKYQLEQKLLKLHNKIEQDFKRSIEKVAKRVSKFHDEFLTAFCRIKGGVSDVDHIDCSKFDQTYKGNRQQRKEEFSNDKFKKQVKNSVNTEKLNPNENDFNMRYKRNDDHWINNDPSNSNTAYDPHINKNTNTKFDQKHRKDKHHGTKKESHYPTQENFESGKVVKKDNLDEIIDAEEMKNVQDPNIWYKQEKKIEKHYKSKEYGGELKKDKKNLYNKYADEKFKSESHYFKKEEQSNIKNKDLGNSEHVTNLKYSEKSDTKTKHDGHKCPKNCEGKLDKFEQKPDRHSQRFVKNEQNSFVKFRNNEKNPSNPSNLHNESIYSKIVNGNGRRKPEASGEWYLDLGEIRNQKRLRRAMKDRDGWLFDRALIRDWCRTNAGSSLCASFGQICDYCV